MQVCRTLDDFMAKVLVVFRVMPKSVETDLELLEKRIKESISPERIERIPIAFGIVALNVFKLIPDESGELEKIENKLKSIDLVSEIEVTEVTRTV